MSQQLATQPPPTPDFILSYPAPHVLLITLNRPKAMNSITYKMHWEGDSLIQWFDNEPNLRVAVITGTGDRAFCAGQDLIEWGENKKNPPPRWAMTHPTTGFMGISRRVGKKPIIAAVNGWALGGGFEIVLGCDMVVASPKAQFGLPEAQRGVWAAAGGLSRLVRIVGLPVASEIALAGRKLSATECVTLGIANKVASSHETVVKEALDLAKAIGELSPDAVIVTRHGLHQALESGSVERASQVTDLRYGKAIAEGENQRIGLAAFAKKQKPQWVPSKL